MDEEQQRTIEHNAARMFGPTAPLLMPSSAAAEHLKHDLRKAEKAVESLLQAIEGYKQTLPEGCEWALSIANSAAQYVKDVTIAAFGSEMVLFRGSDFDGRPEMLVQHYSHISIALIAVSVQDPPASFGFTSRREHD